MQYPHFFLRKRTWIALPFILITLFYIGLVTGSFKATPVSAQTVLPDLRYASTSNTVYIGRPYNSALPAEAPYTAYPSHPDAPKISITIPQLAVALSRYNLFVDQGNGVWLVKANLVVYQNARLDITSPTITELRLESYLTSTTTKKYAKIVASGGQIYIKGDTTSKLKLNSWNTLTNTVDTNYNYGRSYLAALYGARMDIIDSEASYLGWYSPNPNFPEGGVGKGEPSGLSWRFWADSNNRQTGATGSIQNSLIHHNYYGNYTYQATNMQLTGNKVYANIYYGFDPHDYSTGLTITNNEFYNNGYHGLILSRGCTDNVISNNKMYNNAGHGFMLDRGSDRNQVFDNLIYGNTQDGIAIYASSNNVFTNNISRDNVRYGLRIHATYDSTDIFDGLALDNIFTNNTFTGNGKYGINIYERADRNTFLNNNISNNVLIGFYIGTGGNLVQNNTITGNKTDGLYVIGTPAYNVTPGVAPVVPPVDLPGHANNIAQNTVRSNKKNGLAFVKGAIDNQATGNVVESNTENGVYLQASNTKRNLVSQNTITGNTKLGIAISSSANQSMPKPVIKTVVGKLVSGTAKANAKVEIYRDLGDEGKVYKGFTTANSSGAWTFTLPANDSASEGALTAIAIDSLNNTSPFSARKVTSVAAAGADQVDAVDEVAALYAEAEIEAQIEENRIAAEEDMQSAVDPDYSETLRELEQLEAEGAQSINLYLPMVVN